MSVAFVAATTAANPNVSTNTSLAVSLPTASDGDLIIIEVTGYANGTVVSPGMQTPSGWTLLGQRMDDNGTPASVIYIFTRVQQAGDPTSVTLTWSQPGQMIAVARAYSGVSSVADVTFWAKVASDSAYSISLTTTQAGWLAHGFANRTGSPWSNVQDTQRAQVGNSSSSTMIAQDTGADVPAASYTRTATGSTTSVGVGWAFVLVSDAESPPPVPGQVQNWIAAPPMYAAHRGGSADWPESSLYAYEQAADTGIPALEASVWRSSDGVWVISHDRSTLRTHGVDHDIPTTDWATLSTLTSTDGGYPLARLDEALAAHTDKVWLVDNKRDTDTTAFLDFLDAHGGPANIVVKGASTANQAQLARDRGYETWGYYYEGDSLATASHWTLLGMDDHASTAAWSAIKALGKPVLAHVVNDQADLDLAAAQDADGAMLAKVTLVYPSAEPPPPNNAPIISALDVAPTSGDSPLLVTATVTATDAEGALTYAIDWGDGTSASVASASHTYAAAGSYTVTATVTDTEGLTDSATAQVNAAEPPPPTGAGSAIYVLDVDGTTRRAVANVWILDADGTRKPASIDRVI